MEVDCETPLNDAQISSLQCASLTGNNIIENEKCDPSSSTLIKDSLRVSPELPTIQEDSSNSRLSSKSIADEDSNSTISLSSSSVVSPSKSNQNENSNCTESSSKTVPVIERTDLPSVICYNSNSKVLSTFPIEHNDPSSVTNGFNSSERSNDASEENSRDEGNCDSGSADKNKDTSDVNSNKNSTITEEKSLRVAEEESNTLLIASVTSLACLSDDSSFVEPPNGPNSPVLPASNPLEPNHMEHQSPEKNGDSTVSEDLVISLETVSEGEKDSDEVITADTPSASVYSKKNAINEGPENIRKDHVYSKKPRDSDTSKNLKMIYPNSKLGDVSKLPVTRLKAPMKRCCSICKKNVDCRIQEANEGRPDSYYCSDECLRKNKSLQLHCLFRKQARDVVSEKDIPADSRLCANCDGVVSVLSEDNILSWEAMEFCDEDCLGKYQTKMWSFCSACKKDVPTASMGKYCVRFGHEVKQFCSSLCLDEFKKSIKVCSYCQKDLCEGEGFMTPIGEKGHCRDFCSQRCLDEYECMNLNLPAGGLKVEPCAVCDKVQLVQVQVITENNNVNLCSEVCFAAFKFVNTSLSPAPCHMCKKFFDKTLSTCVTTYFDKMLLTFCSKSCMNVSILATRTIVNCFWCKVKKYNFDMIRKKQDGRCIFYCSVNCMTLYKVSAQAVRHKSLMNCIQCKKLDFPNFHLTMSDATVRNFCSLDCVNKFQATFSKGPTGNKIVPTGVPKRIVRTRVSEIREETKSTPADKTPSAGTTTSNGVTKKTENQLVNHATNGPSSTIPSQTSVQLVKYHILDAPSKRVETANVRIQVKPRMFSKAISVEKHLTDKYIQTESENNEKISAEKAERSEEDKKNVNGPVLIPVPVPIYIPCPMAMYSVPAPTPFPLPLPLVVPLFIPTTKGTAEEILDDIKRIQEKIPGNPYEAELIMMAELEHKKSNESDDPSASEVQKNSQKRPCSAIDSLDSGASSGPPEKKAKAESEDAKETFKGVVIPQIAASALPMSLKETLGVSAWRHYAAEVGEKKDLLEMTPSELAQALKGFILNAKIPGAGDYSPTHKYYLMLGIQYYLEESGRVDNIFFDEIFEPFIEVLNQEALKFQSLLVVCGNMITKVEEEHLWESKQLGPHSPFSLLQTLIYFNTKYFNLTTVEEHMQLSFSHVIKHWKRNPSISTGSTSNTNNGARNILLRFYPPQAILEKNSKKKKVYEQKANEEDPYKCPIYLYEFYISKCPESVKSRSDLFYMSPERSCVPDSPIWFSTLPLSEDIVERTLNRFKMVKEINQVILSG